MNLSWQPLSEQVVTWLTLLRSGRATPADHANFVAWREADPRHENAWQQFNDTLRRGAETGRLSDAYPYARDDQARAPRGMRMGLNRRHFIGGLLVLGGAAAVTAGANVVYPLEGLTNDIATQTGERRLYRLSDGTLMLLDARTRIDMAYTNNERVLNLLEGALSLTVQLDPSRPFVVRTAEGTVHPLGAHAMVRQQARRTLVVAPSNDVIIETKAGLHAVLPAGQGTRFDHIRTGDLRADLLTSSAWEQGWIDAQGCPLADVITALRPYYEGVLRVSMAAGGLPVHGRFPLDAPSTTLRMLESQLTIQVSRFTPWITTIDVASI